MPKTAKNINKKSYFLKIQFFVGLKTADQANKNNTSKLVLTNPNQRC